MKRLDTFVGQDLGRRSDIDYLQDAKADAIKERVSDFHNYGVLRGIPSLGNEFAISLTSGNTQINVGPGVAYNSQGERIAITTNEPFQSTNFVFNGVNVIRNSGNQNIPLTSSDVNFVWIEYLLIHDLSNASESISELNVLHYIRRVDGYRIIVTNTSTPPNGAGISILLGRVVKSTSTIDLSNRDIFGQRDVTIQVTPNTSDKTTSYISGTKTSLKEHINAIGSGAIGPSNPHGITLDDLPIGTLPNSMPGTTVLSEITNARGSQSSIDARLDVELNEDGTAKAKGSTANLSARLAAEHNPSGKHTIRTAHREVPVGAINGTNGSDGNRDFVLSRSILADDDGRSTAHVYVNGLEKEGGFIGESRSDGTGSFVTVTSSITDLNVDYHIQPDLKTIRFHNGSVPLAGSAIWVTYNYSNTTI